MIKHGFLPLPTLLLAAGLTALAGCSSPEDTKRAHRQRAEEHAAAGKYHQARVELQNVLRIDPGDTGARIALAENLERLGSYRQAAAQYTRVMADDPEHTLARLRMGRLYLMAREPEQALELAEAMPGAPAAGAHALRAAAYLALGNLDRARAASAAALDVDPADLDAAMVAAELASRDDDHRRASELIRAALTRHPDNDALLLRQAEYLARAGYHPEAISVIRSHIEAQPEQELTLRLRLARYFERLKRVDEAEAEYRKAIALGAGDGAASLAFARFLAQRRGIAAAERFLITSAAASQDPVPLEMALAKLYRFTGQSEKRKAIYRRIIATQKTQAAGLVAMTALADMHAREGNEEEAGRLVEAVLAENPIARGALSLRAKLALSRDDFPTAVGDLRTVLRDNPDDAESLWMLGLAYQRSGEPDAAERAFRDALRASPTAWKPRLAMVGLLAGRGDRAGARKELEAGLEAAPDSLALLAAVSRMQMAEKDWAGVAATADRLKRAHPNHAVGYFLAGRAAQAAGNLRMAAVELERAAELAPGREDAFLGTLIADARSGSARLQAGPGEDGENARDLRLLGRFLRRLERFDESAELLERALDIDPGQPVTTYELAHSLHARGETPRAIRLLEGILGATENPPLALIMGLARMYEARGDHERAIALYERHLARYPRSEPAANNLAMLLANRRDDPDSLERAAALAARFQESRVPAYLDTLGWVHHRRGNTRQAIALLEKAAELSPQVPSIQFHLGAALVSDGRIAQGRERLERSLRAGSPFPERSQALAMLERVADR